MINLKTGWIKDIRYYLELASTQDHAIELAQAGAKEGTLVVAEVQTCGRGRKGEKWYSPKGGLWFSFILKPPAVPVSVPMLSLGMALSAVRAIKRATGLDAFIKWPNDISLDGRKLGGILIDMETRSGRCEYIVAGIGLNTNVNLRDCPVELKKDVVSLHEVTGRLVDDIEILGAVLDETAKVYKLFKNGKSSSILGDARDHCWIIGKRVRVTGLNSDKGFVEGQAYDISEKGGLLVRIDPGGVIELFSGSVEVLS